MSIITNLWDSQLVEASNLTVINNEQTDLLVSANIDNSSGTEYNSCKVSLVYDELTPVLTSLSAYIGCVVEFDDNGRWELTPCYQFTALRKSNQEPQRDMILQPNMDTFNAGIDDIVFPANSALCRISRSNGALPEENLRVRVFMVETDKDGANAFVSVKVTGTMERYNV